MRLIFFTPSLIGSIFGGVYHLTNRQVVLMGFKSNQVNAKLLLTFITLEVTLKIQIEHAVINKSYKMKK